MLPLPIGPRREQRSGPQETADVFGTERRVKTQIGH